MNETPLLSVDHVTAGYAPGLDILEDISLSVHRGAISGLIGLNGAGKSTLMKVICGFLSPRTGRIVLDGEEITNRPPYRMIDLGLWYIPQESSLFPMMSVKDNFELVARRHPEKEKALARIPAVLDEFTFLRDKYREPAGSLSGGQQKILELAKLRLVQPRVCLIDEPSLGLAPAIVDEVYGFIASCADDGMGILLVDHNVRAVIKLSTWVSVLSLGQITASGPVESFRTDLHSQVQEWLGLSL